MKQYTKRLTGLAVAAALAAPAAALATNGYFAHGYGTQNKGLAGAGAALPQGTIAAATNPAGMVFVGGGADLGAALFSPRRKYTAGPATAPADGTPCPGTGCPFTIGGNTGNQSIESDNEYFLIPHFGYNKMLDAQSSFGVTVYGNGGMNTEYNGGQAQHDDGSAFPAPGNLTTTPGTFGAGTAGVDLAQLFVAATYSRKFSPTASWGASLIAAYQQFEAKGLGTFAGASKYGANVSDKGRDTSTGFGAKFGIQGEVSPGLTLAASYQTKMSMSEFDKYKGLFAEGGDFDIPSTWTIGLAYKVTPNSVLAFDIQRINYTDVKSVSNPMFPALNNCGNGTGDVEQCLGGSNGPGFGWDDMTVYKLGYQWQGQPGWTWRVGFSTGSQPIPESEVLFNILAPGVMEEHITFGFTKEMGPNNALSFSALYAPTVEVSGQNPLNPSQKITLEMDQIELELSYSWKF